MPQRAKITTPLRRVWWWTTLVAVYSCLSLVKLYYDLDWVPDIPSLLEAALSFAMAFVIAFRVNRAYERWWEARALWGTLVNVSRNLAVKIRQLHQADAVECRYARDLIIAFCTGLKDHLRDDGNLQKLPGFETSNARPLHIPSFIVGRFYGLFSSWKADGRLTDQQLWVLDAETRVLLEVCGGCEKIKTTLMSVSWRRFTWQCIIVYLLVMPWGIVDDFQFWTMPLMAVVAYFVIAGEAIAQFVEEPFGVHEDHLDLERIVAVIDQSVSEALLESL